MADYVSVDLSILNHHLGQINTMISQSQPLEPLFRENTSHIGQVLDASAMGGLKKEILTTCESITQGLKNIHSTLEMIHHELASYRKNIEHEVEEAANSITESFRRD